MYHDAINRAFCSVKYIANHIHYPYYIAPDDASLPIGYVGNIQHFTTANITLAVW